jgi:Subtilase family/PKD-like domain/Secretion system C-terminal sorting domain
MKLFSTTLSSLLLALITPIFLLAQTPGDFSIYLNSGKFVPDNNINIISKSDEMFQKSLFQDKHYVAIQFYALPNQSTKDQLQAAGIELGDYLPNNTYAAAVSKDMSMAALKSFNIRGIFQLAPYQKTVSSLLNGNAPQHAVKQPGYADVNIVTYEKLNAATVQTAITFLNAAIIEDVPAFKMFTVRISIANAKKLIELPFVQWAEFIDPPNQPENLLGRSLHRVNVLQDGIRNLKGEGINIGVFDERTSPHLDFTGRLTNVDAGAAGSHGTHVSGTIGGAGLINPIAKGMAPKANIFSYYGFSGDVQVIMSTAIPANILISSNHSYHDGLGVQCGTSGASAGYSLRARNTDLNINNNPYHLHCHSSGNAQTSCSEGWGTITGAGKAAKNIIVVGNITTSETLSGSSSCGPVHDGRIKPEIVGMGTSVFSTYTPLNTYGTISGTSMSTPGITGLVGLLVQRYKQLNGNVLPNSALIKNVACNTARDLGNVGPDYRFGFGRVNALAAVRVLEQNRYVTNAVATGGANEFTITVPAGATRLNVMITWNDPAAAANASLAIVNSLDLMVIKGAEVSRPWILDKENPAASATKAKDTVSNIEQVTIDNPTGTYTVRVEGVAVPIGPTQTYFVSWNIEQPSIEVIYPNGSESFNPAGSETITWDNAGLTGNQTVEYSLDNGATWTVISSTVPAAVTRLTWSVPSANTSTALIRVTSGSIADVSDNTFKIFGTASGLTTTASCAAGSVAFNWAATANATHYDIMKLNTTTATWETAATDITGTSHTVTGLPPFTSMWFALVAKNNTTGAIGERSLAINRTVPITGLTPGAVTGTNTLCEASATNYTYTVPVVTGASSYTWTVPAGATIVSGQGSTSLIVNYPAGAASGNISVVVNDAGGCSSAASVRAITVNPLPAKPTVSWNGTQLTTASGLAGYKWYFNNVLIGGATTNTYAATAAGLYKVEVSNANACINTSDEFNLVLTGLSDVIVEGSKIQVFPNPANEKLVLKVTQQSVKKISMTILNADGKVMYADQIQNGLVEINTQQYAAGFYLVRINGAKETQTIKIQVIH